MSKYILFSHKPYYPYGGMNDSDGVFDTLQDALSFDRFATDYEVLQIPELIVHEQYGRAIPLADYIRSK